METRQNTENSREKGQKSSSHTVAEFCQKLIPIHCFRTKKCYYMQGQLYFTLLALGIILVREKQIIHIFWKQRYLWELTIAPVLQRCASQAQMLRGWKGSLWPNPLAIEASTGMVCALSFHRSSGRALRGMDGMFLYESICLVGLVYWIHSSQLL